MKFKILVRVLLSFCILERCFQLSTLQTPPTLRWIPFLDFVDGKRFSGRVINIIKSPSSRYCGMRCTRHPECRSFNMCSHLYCDLNFHDIYSAPNGTDLLQDSPKCAYHGMQREDHPICSEKGEQKQMQVNNLGVCQIGLKRVDREWTEWEKETKKDPFSYLEFMARKMIIDVAHGGIEGDDNRERLYSKKWFYERSCPFHKCRSQCVSKGGSLIGYDLASAISGQICDFDTDGSWIDVCTGDQGVWRTGESILNEVVWSFLDDVPEDEQCCVFKSCTPGGFSCIRISEGITHAICILPLA